MRGGLRLLPLILAAVVLPGCIVRQVRPSLGGPRDVDTGVPVTFGSDAEGAPEYSYDFGDGSPLEKGKLVRHAYNREGRYQVYALREDQQPVDGVVLTAVPRKVTRALPEKLQGAIFLKKLGGNLDPLIDFLEKLAGAEAAQGFIENNPLVELGLELSAGQGALSDRGIDPDEGMGMFSVPSFDGQVALIGVTDGDKALNALVASLTKGSTRAWSGNDGTTRLLLKDGREAALFVDRGYLYLAIPESPPVPSEFSEPPEDEIARESGMNRTDFTPALDAVKKAHPLGFEGTGTLVGLSDKVKDGTLYVYAQTQKDVPQAEQGAFLSLFIHPMQLNVDGFVRMKGRPWSGAQSGKLFSAMPEKPVAAVTVSVPPEELATFFFGKKGSDERNQTAAKARSAGIAFEELLASLTGKLEAAAYFDARAFYAALAKGEQPRPVPKGTLLVSAGVNDPQSFANFLELLARDSGEELQRSEGPDGAHYRGVAKEQPFDIALSKDQLSVNAGEPIDGRQSVDLGAQLRDRFGPESFSPGHLSAMVDVAELRAEVNALPELPGVPKGKLQLFQSFALALLSELPPVDVVFVDVEAVEQGAKLRGQLVLRQ
ncbi:MAG: PKD domain-containing protein [Myxococcaceae bacterium]